MNFSLIDLDHSRAKKLSPQRKFIYRRTLFPVGAGYDLPVSIWNFKIALRFPVPGYSRLNMFYRLLNLVFT